MENGPLLSAPFPGAPTGQHLRSALIEDAAVQAAMQPWIKMECVQLDRGREIARMDTLDLGGPQAVRERQFVTVQKLGVTPTDLCTISCCSLDPTARFSHIRPVKSGAVYFMPEQIEFDIYIPVGVETNYVSLSQEAFLATARVLNPVDWEDPPRQVITAQTSGQTELETAISVWFDTARAISTRNWSVNPEIVAARMTEQIIRLVAAPRGAAPLPSFLERSRALQICRTARAYVDACLEENVLPTIVDVCKQVGASERTLQYAFLAYVNRSPQSYLRLCRLNRARALLRASDPRTTRVTEVATRFGFYHLGRFAQDYRQMFGESPSETLASV